MAGTTNFVQQNPTAANQQSDGTYAAYSLTTGGVGVDATLPSPWLNKIWYQCTTFIAALAGALATKGYTITDTSISALQTVLAAIITLADFTTSLGVNGYVRFPGGLVIQWGTTGSIVNDTATAVNFPIAFPNACLAVVVTDTFADSKSGVWSAYAYTTTQFTARPDGNTLTGTFIAVGW